MAVTVIVLVVGLVGAFTVDGDAADTDLATVDRTTTTVGSDESTTTTATLEDSPAIGGNTATTTSAKATSTTVAIGSVADPGPSKPPAPGTYTYKFVYASDPSRNTDIDQRVETQPDKDGVQYRKETYPDGQGNKLTNDLSYSPDGVRLLASHIAAQQGNIDCNWTPPIHAFKTPVTVGAKWSTDSKCSTTSNGVQVTVQRKSDYKVTGKSSDIVGTTPVRTWVIEEHAVTSVTTPYFPTTRDAVITRHWSPDYGLLTFESEIGKNNGQDYRTERTLHNLKPK